MLLSLKNKKIIISAGASGIGWATAKVCLSKGAHVFLCDLDSKSIKKTQKHPLNNKRLFSYECDASDEDDVTNFFNQVYKKTKMTQQKKLLKQIKYMKFLLLPKHTLQNMLTHQLQRGTESLEMVRLRRLELPRVLSHSDLNAARLPVPPQPH